ncbi:MAG TPA: tRNA pseudouridine(38-40) synthase TruA [bacterium]|nr:tRNA pseudouridine(38-40) synthase TruA [bacterium]
MRNIKIVLEYDGTDFCGWQFQPNLRTVQQNIQAALKQIFRQDITVIGAGRTDSGVHARGQVANFHIDSEMAAEKIMAALNGNLPKDIRILSAEQVSPDFNSRYSAKKRHYQYVITQVERAINRNYMWCYKNKLDVEKMQRASKYLLGRQDFKSFCAQNVDLEHHYCTVEKIDWEQKESILSLNIVANRFIHSMVRIIVGTMIDVGRGFTEVEKIPEILAAKDRKKSGQTVPAKGLCLEKVYY